MKHAIIQSISHHPFHGGCEFLERRSQIAAGDVDGAMSEQIPNGFERSANLFQPLGNCVAQPVGCEIRNTDLGPEGSHVALQGPGGDREE